MNNSNFIQPFNTASFDNEGNSSASKKRRRENAFELFSKKMMKSMNELQAQVMQKFSIMEAKIIHLEVGQKTLIEEIQKIKQSVSNHPIQNQLIENIQEANPNTAEIAIKLCNEKKWEQAINEFEKIKLPVVNFTTNMISSYCKALGAINQFAKAKEIIEKVLHRPEIKQNFNIISEVDPSL